MSSLFVLDCSVAAKWILPEPDRAAALELLERYELGEIALIAPDLLLAEFASLLAKRTRRNQLSAAQASQAFQLMCKSAPRLLPMEPRLARALALSIEHQLALWDCVYLAIAMEHDCPIITANRRLFRGHTGRHPTMMLLKPPPLP